jgi:integrase
MTRRLTELACARAKPVRERRIELFDGPGGIAGLCLRITPLGVKSWSLYYRVGGRQRRLTLGRHPNLPLAEARRRARVALEQADRGVDPAGERVERRPGRDTVEGVVGQYLELHVRRNRQRRAADVERMLRSAVLPHWGPRPVRSITKHDVLDLVDSIAARAPVMANRVQALLKRLFAWAAERGIIEASPIASLRPPAKERSRDRVLSDHELAAIWRAAGELGWPWDPIIRLLTLTAARRSEVAGMRWSEIDVERKLWVKPGSRTKAGRAHELPLSAAALDLVEALPRIDGSDLVFPARSGGGPASGFTNPKRRLDHLAGVAGWKLHDLRRTAASGMARLGAAPHVVAAVLDHSPASLIGVTAIYQRHKHEAEARAALERWADHVLALAGGRTAKVVNIR